MSPPLNEKAAPERTRGRQVESHSSPTIQLPERQAPITGGMYSRRAEWIFDGLADLELSGVSCLLSAPAGGEAMAILRRLPQPLTIPVLDELVGNIRLAHSRRLFRNWPDTTAEFSDDWCEQLRVYSQGPKVNFTDQEAAVHKALVDLVVREGGDPWTR